MPYPPTVDELRRELTPYPLHGDLSDTELQSALEEAQSELHVAVPAFAKANGSSYEMLARRLCLSLARWYVRMARERTPDGELPPGLVTERRALEMRIQQAQSSFSVMPTIEPYEQLEPMPLPNGKVEESW